MKKARCLEVSPRSRVGRALRLAMRMGNEKAGSDPAPLTGYLVALEQVGRLLEREARLNGWRP